LLTFGNSFLQTIDRNMERSIVNSISGQFQLTQSGAKDKFELFSMDGGTAKDFGTITNFKKVREVIEALPNVKSVIPMGFNFAVVTTGNLLDRKLTDLRQALNANDSRRKESLLKLVKRLVDSLSADEKTAEALVDPKRQKALAEDKQNLETASAADFWAKFNAQGTAMESLEFLENKIARLMPGEAMAFMMYLGTDLERFRASFDRFEKVDGELVPPGKRGILFNKKFYEEQLKNKTAKRLDEIKERIDLGDSFDGCEDCKQAVKLNIGQVKALVAQFDDEAEAIVRRDIGAAVGKADGEVVEVLKQFFEMNGDNFLARYKLFYDVIAPRILLYSVNIGDTFVLKSFGKGGYVRSVPVKVYGTFNFRGLDKSPITGAFSLIDMTSFRELYGVTTPESMAELAELKKNAGVKEVTAENAEDELFGEGATVESEASSQKIVELDSADLEQARKQYAETVADLAYTQDEIDSGLVVNAAVMLKDDSKTAETRAAIDAALSANDLGITVTEWRDAAGVVGVLIMVFNVVLWAAMFIFTIVALIIVNNALMMSTLQRTAEIGTLRAIGASKETIRRMIGFEAVLLATLFGGAGVAVAVALLQLLGGGFAVTSDFAQFLAGGTTFTPQLTLTAFIVGCVFTLVSGVLSTIYPTWVATRITPREAMSRQD
jgi:ABC-type antimicrobial peptide transport system permease subunit